MYRENFASIWVLTFIALNCFGRIESGDSTFLNDADKTRLLKIVEIKDILKDNISNIYYYVHINTRLGKSIPDSSKICAHIKSIPIDSLESIFFVTTTAVLLTGCKLETEKLSSKLLELVKEDSTVLDLYRAGSSLVNIGKPIDSAKFSKLLMASLKREESLLNTGLAFQLAAKFNKGPDQNVFADKIADIVVQADEVNGKYLQYEGGLGVSAAVVNGIYQLSTASKKSLSISKEQALKFFNYFLSRKYVLTSKGASEVIESLSLFTNNNYHIPYVITKFGSAALSANNPVLTLKITNVLGQSVSPVAVTATLIRSDEKNPILSNLVFKPVTGDSTLYAFDFFEKPLQPGFYTVTVSAVPQKSDTRIIGNTNVVIPVNLLTQVEIVNAELSINDVDVGSKNLKLQHPSSVKEILDVDNSQRIQLKFQVKDRQNGNVIDVHQAFLRFFHPETKQEIIFISELDSTRSQHKVELNLQARSKDFNSLSGLYQVNLIVGDVLITESIDWKIGSLNIQFSGSQPTTPKLSKTQYGPKPEIKHVFREQDKRPHALVSTFFTALVVLPLIALLVMWYKIGINISGFSFTPSAIVFHLTLGGIFVLYGLFFYKLNMFQTIKYLTGLSFVAYLSGHSLLSSFIAKK